MTGARAIVAGDGEVAAAVARRLRADGADVARLDGDGVKLAREDAARTAVEAAAAGLGGLDVLVTAFARREERAFLDTGDDLWERMLDENLKAPFLVSREAARVMAGGNGGVIVHVGSDVAARPGPRQAAYAAARAGGHLLATAMALDLVPDGVRVCCVAHAEAGEPRASAAEDTAAAVAFCASPAASYVLGSTFYVDGLVPVRG